MPKKSVNEDYEKIEQMLKAKRDDLSKGSLRTYARVLHAFNKRMYDDSVINPERYIKDKDEIIKDMADKKPNSVRTLLSAIILITDDPNFRDLMTIKIKEQKDFINQNEMTQKQKENWVTKEEIEEKLEKHRKMAEALYKHITFTSVGIQCIQDYIILCLVSGIYFPPRRSADFTEMRINLTPKQKAANDCNYMDKGKFVFNVFKTAKTAGQQIVDIPKKLQQILKKWLMVNKHDYLLINSNGDKLTPTTLGARISTIFGKHMGTTAFRRLYLTDKYEDTVNEMKEMKQDMKEMGSSAAQINHYVKNTEDLKK